MGSVVPSRVLGSHMVKFGFVAELGSHGDPRVPPRGGGRGGSEELGAVTFHCIRTDNVVLGGLAV